MKPILLLIAFLFFSTNLIFAQTTGWNYNDNSASDFKVVDRPKGKLPSDVSKFLDELKLIEGGKLPKNRIAYRKISSTDSSLLFSGTPKIVTISSFLISEHEVTNKQYRKFVDWVKDSIAREFLAKTDAKYYLANSKKYLNWDVAINWSDSLLINHMYNKERFRRYLNTGLLCYKSDSAATPINIYPDTNNWASGKFGYNDALMQQYFWHPAYSEYPVVCVSWEQANAYCKWLSKQLEQLFMKNKTESPLPNFRLPLEVEWEYAAYGNTYIDGLANNIYPWNESALINNKAKYFANFGPIIDEHGCQIKQYNDDGYVFTSPIKSFAPNNYLLFDMAGNVSEWVADNAEKITFGEEQNVNIFGAKGDNNRTLIDPSLTPEQLFNKLKAHAKEFLKANELKKDSLGWEWNSVFSGYEEMLKNNERTKKFWLDRCEKMLHDAKIVNTNKTKRIVKGGSWLDGAAYLQCGARQAFDENAKTPFIGFRVAMTNIDSGPQYFKIKYKKKPAKKGKKK